MTHAVPRDHSISLTRTELARHLTVDRSTLPAITADLALGDIAGRYPWQRVIRAVHQTDIALLPGYLTGLQRRHALPILDQISDIFAELRAPLMTFQELAAALGSNPNTLSRALRESRFTLPIFEIRLGPRLRRYRPLDVRLWRDEGIVLALPRATRAVVNLPPKAIPETANSRHTLTPSESAFSGRLGAAQTSGSHDQADAQKALFGAFLRDSQPINGIAGKKRNSP